MKVWDNKDAGFLDCSHDEARLACGMHAFLSAFKEEGTCTVGREGTGILGSDDLSS